MQAVSMCDVTVIGHPAPASPPTRAAWVDQLLRRAILTGELAPGEKLLGEKLAEQWGVSPTPLRESFQRLAGEGLVVIEPQRGARVAPIDAATALHVYELRLLLDPAALRSSMRAAAGDAGYADEVGRALRRLEGRHRAMVDFHDAHRAFHLALVSRCSNPLLLQQVGHLRDQSQRYQVWSAGARGGDAGQEHRDLAAAAAAGDVRAAVAVLTAHLRASRDAIPPSVDALSDS